MIRVSGVLIEKKLDPSKRSISGYITTIDADRAGDVVIPDGMRFDSYMVNPIVLMNHDYQSLPVAKTVALKADARGIRADMEFATSGDAIETWELVKGGFLNAFSVGFVADATVTKGQSNFSTLAGTWAAGDSAALGNVARFIIRSTLLEVSIVPVPCNPAALIDFVSKSESMRSLSPIMRKRLGLVAEQVKRITVERACSVVHHIDVAALIQGEVKKTLDKMRGRIA